MDDEGKLILVAALAGIFLGFGIGVFLASNNDILGEHINDALDLCAPNGGLEGMDVDTITCENGARFSYGR